MESPTVALLSHSARQTFLFAELVEIKLTHYPAIRPLDWVL
jgi:hypothetical protein